MNALVIEAQRVVMHQPELAREIARQLNGRPLGGGLTKRQRELLDFIRGYVTTHGYSPSFDEMMKALGLASKSGVHRLVHGLRDRGYIEFRYNQARSVNLRRQA